MCCEEVTDCGESVLKKVYTGGLQPMLSSHTGADKKCEEEGRPEKSYYGLTVTHSPSPFAAWQEKEQSEELKLNSGKGK